MARSKSKRRRVRDKKARRRAQLENAGAGGGGRDEGLGTWVPPLDQDKIVADARTKALKEYEKHLALAREMNELLLKNIKQQTVEEMDRITITTSPTPEDMKKFIAKLTQRALKVAPFTIPVVVHGVKLNVPVTPPKPENPEDATYHLRVIRDPPTGSEVHVLVEDWSGYIKAFRVVMKGDVESEKDWHCLRPDGLPSRFKNTRFTNYSDGYIKLDGICIHSGTFREIFKFFQSFDAEPDQVKTNDGQRTLETSIICLGEFPRFGEVQRLVIEGVKKPAGDPSKLPIGFNALIHDWSVLSKDIFQLYLALLEARMCRNGYSTPSAREAMVKAREMWKDRQENHSLIKFYHKQEGVKCEDTPIDLSHLCGGQLHVLRYDDDACDKVRMRLGRYTGHWKDGIQKAFLSGDLKMF